MAPRAAGRHNTISATAPSATIIQARHPATDGPAPRSPRPVPPRRGIDMLAAVALAVCPGLLLVLGLMRQPVRQRSRQVKQLESSARSVVQEGLGAIRVVKAFAQEERETQRFVHRSLEGLNGRLRLVVAQGGYGLLRATILGAGTNGILLIGVRHV